MMVTIICLHCGKVAEKYRNPLYLKPKYCSRSCQFAHNKRKLKEFDIKRSYKKKQFENLPGEKRRCEGCKTYKPIQLFNYHNGKVNLNCRKCVQKAYLRSNRKNIYGEREV